MNHVVYTLYNAAGEAIYVGVTSRWPHRLRTHEREKAWYPEVARHEVERFADANAARDHEHKMIQSLKPKHNRKTYHQGKTGPLNVDRVPVKFKHSVETDQLLDALCDRLAGQQGTRSRTIVLEIAIRELAKQWLAEQTADASQD